MTVSPMASCCGLTAEQMQTRAGRPQRAQSCRFLFVACSGSSAGAGGGWSWAAAGAPGCCAILILVCAN